MIDKTVCIAVLAFVASVPCAAAAQDTPSGLRRPSNVPKPSGPPAPAPPAEDAFVGYIQWASVAAGGGNYGGHLSVSAFILRWRWFYWSILKITGGGGKNGGNDKFEMGYYGTAGTRIGVPVHFGPQGMHEIRGGVGIAGGIIQQEVYRTWWQETKMWYCTSHGPFLQIELMYQFHIKRRFAVLVGYENSFVFNEHEGNGHPDDGWQASHQHAGFLGMAF